MREGGERGEVGGGRGEGGGERGEGREGGRRERREEGKEGGRDEGGRMLEEREMRKDKGVTGVSLSEPHTHCARAYVCLLACGHIPQIFNECG